MDGGVRRSRRVDYPKHDRQPAGRGQAPPPRNLPRAQAGVCGDDSEWPPPARPVLPDFGPERVRGRPRSHSPREQRPPPQPGSRSVRIVKAGRCWGSPRSPGSSRGLGEHRPGWGRSRARPPQRGASGATADPSPAAASTALTVSAPPPWNSDQARRGGWGRELLKGPLSSPGRRADWGRSWSLLTRGRARNPVCDESAWPSRPGPRSEARAPRQLYQPRSPIPTQASPTVPPWLVFWRGIWALLIAASPLYSGLPGEGPTACSQDNSGSGRGQGLQSHLRLGWTSLSQINEWRAFFRQCRPQGVGGWPPLCPLRMSCSTLNVHVKP